MVAFQRVRSMVLLAANVMAATNTSLSTTLTFSTVTTPSSTLSAVSSTAYAIPTATTFTEYALTLTYLASTSCPSTWTFQTQIYLGYDWSTSVTPPTPYTTVTGSVYTDTETDTYSAYTTTTTLTNTEQPTVILPLSNLPFASLASFQSLYSPPWAAECTIPASSYYSPGFTSEHECEILCFNATDYANILGGAIGGWFALFFVFGLVQNFYYFREMCTGKEARRGLPRCWSCLSCPLSCLLLFGSNRGYVARPRAERQALQERWDAMSTQQRLSLWLRWGFRLQYPPFLGPPPERKRKQVHQPVPRTRMQQERLQQASRTGVASMEGRPARHEADDDPPPMYTAEDESIALPAWSGGAHMVEHAEV